jgi:short-subunit dehydrogenase
VAVCARNKKDLDVLYGELHRNFLMQKLSQQCDVVTKNNSRHSPMKSNTRNTVEVLVNNAGICLPGDVQRKVGTLEKLLKTNLYSAYYLTQNLVKLMIH